VSESNEPSYYEIALTNRQVLVSFVVLLCCVLAAFVSGVWVGRKGTAPLPEDGTQVAAADAAAGDLEQLEEFKFFSDQEKAAAGRDPGKAGARPPAESTLAEDVGSASPPPAAPPPPRAAPPPPRAVPPPSAPAPPRQAPPRPAPPRPAPPRPAPPPPTSASPAQPQEGFVIQVLSTRDEARAKRILGQLQQGSYPAFMSPVQVGSQVNYRVRIGPYPDRPPAEKAAQAVNAKYKLDTWITAAGN